MGGTEGDGASLVGAAQAVDARHCSCREADELTERLGRQMLLDAIDAALASRSHVLGKIREGKIHAGAAVIGSVMKEVKGTADVTHLHKPGLERTGR